MYGTRDRSTTSRFGFSSSIMARSDARNSGETCKSIAPSGEKMLGGLGVAITGAGCHSGGPSVNAAAGLKLASRNKKKRQPQNTAGAFESFVRVRSGRSLQAVHDRADFLEVFLFIRGRHPVGEDDQLIF